MELKIAEPITVPTLKISLYNKGYIRCNKALTVLLGLKAGDLVNFYQDSNGNYYFGKSTTGIGYKIRRQANVHAMFFNAQGMSRTLRNHYNLGDTPLLHIFLLDTPVIKIEGERYVPLKYP